MATALVIAWLRPLLSRLLPSILLVLACGNVAGYAQESFASNRVGEVASLLPDPAIFSPQDRIALHFVEQGLAALSREDFQRARIFFERAVIIAPLQPYSYYFLGRTTFAQGDARQALAFLLKAELVLSEENLEWLAKTKCLQGMIYEDLGAYGEARLSYRRCLEISPQSLSAITALARLPDENAP